MAVLNVIVAQDIWKCLCVQDVFLSLDVLIGPQHKSTRYATPPVKCFFLTGETQTSAATSVHTDSQTDSRTNIKHIYLHNNTVNFIWGRRMPVKRKRCNWNSITAQSTLIWSRFECSCYSHTHKICSPFPLCHTGYSNNLTVILLFLPACTHNKEQNWVYNDLGEGLVCTIPSTLIW